VHPDRRAPSRPPGPTDQSTATAHLINRVTRCPASCDDITGLLLVGSYARNTARPDSDIDLVVLTTEPSRYSSTTWADDLDLGTPTGTQPRGPLTEQRFITGSGLETEINIGPPNWADTNPIDPGTYRVITDGAHVLHDPNGALARLQHACQPQPATPEPEDA